jgi:chromosome segregation ATPase
MNLEDLVSRLDSLEEHMRSLNKSLITANSRLNEVDEKANNFLGMVRDQKKDLERLNSVIMGMGKYDSTINQIRKDFNRNIEEIEAQRKHDDQIRTNMINKDIISVQSQFEGVKKEIKNDYEKRLNVFIEENSRLVNRFNEIAEENKKNVISSEDLKVSIGVMQQDLRRTIKQVESIKIDQDLFRESQNDLRTKMDPIMDSLRNNESRLNDLVATESERRQNQLDFMQKQSELAGDRERKWAEWNQDIENSIQQVREILPELQKQQFAMAHTKEDFENVTQQFDRRIKEITEMYRLMEERYKKEWDTFKADAEKRWSNISLVLNDKQGGVSEKLLTLQERMTLVEDNNHEMQEALLLMSSEIQKGMQGIMKMVNGWMEAFNQIKNT